MSRLRRFATIGLVISNLWASSIGALPPSGFITIGRKIVEQGITVVPPKQKDQMDKTLKDAQELIEKLGKNELIERSGSNLRNKFDNRIGQSTLVLLRSVRNANLTTEYQKFKDDNNYAGMLAVYVAAASLNNSYYNSNKKEIESLLKEITDNTTARSSAVPTRVEPPIKAKVPTKLEVKTPAVAEIQSKLNLYSLDTEGALELISLIRMNATKDAKEGMGPDLVTLLQRIGKDYGLVLQEPSVDKTDAGFDSNILLLESTIDFIQEYFTKAATLVSQSNAGFDKLLSQMDSTPNKKLMVYAVNAYLNLENLLGPEEFENGVPKNPERIIELLKQKLGTTEAKAIANYGRENWERIIDQYVKTRTDGKGVERITTKEKEVLGKMKDINFLDAFMIGAGYQAYSDENTRSDTSDNAIVDFALKLYVRDKTAISAFFTNALPNLAKVTGSTERFLAATAALITQIESRYPETYEMPIEGTQLVARASLNYVFIKIGMISANMGEFSRFDLTDNAVVVGRDFGQKLRVRRPYSLLDRDEQGNILFTDNNRFERPVAPVSTYQPNFDLVGVGGGTAYGGGTNIRLADTTVNPQTAREVGAVGNYMYPTVGRTRAGYSPSYARISGISEGALLKAINSAFSGEEFRRAYSGRVIGGGVAGAIKVQEDTKPTPFAAGVLTTPTGAYLEGGYAKVTSPTERQAGLARSYSVPFGEIADNDQTSVSYYDEDVKDGDKRRLESVRNVITWYTGKAKEEGKTLKEFLGNHVLYWNEEQDEATGTKRGRGQVLWSDGKVIYKMYGGHDSLVALFNQIGSEIVTQNVTVVGNIIATKEVTPQMKKDIDAKKSELEQAKQEKQNFLNVPSNSPEYLAEWTKINDAYPENNMSGPEDPKYKEKQTKIKELQDKYTEVFDRKIAGLEIELKNLQGDLTDFAYKGVAGGGALVAIDLPNDWTALLMGTTVNALDGKRILAEGAAGASKTFRLESGGLLKTSKAATVIVMNRTSAPLGLEETEGNAGKPAEPSFSVELRYREVGDSKAKTPNAIELYTVNGIDVSARQKDGRWIKNYSYNGALGARYQSPAWLGGAQFSFNNMFGSTEARQVSNEFADAVKFITELRELGLRTYGGITRDEFAAFVSFVGTWVTNSPQEGATKRIDYSRAFLGLTFLNKYNLLVGYEKYSGLRTALKNAETAMNDIVRDPSQKDAILDNLIRQAMPDLQRIYHRGGLAFNGEKFEVVGSVEYAEGYQDQKAEITKGSGKAIWTFDRGFLRARANANRTTDLLAGSIGFGLDVTTSEGWGVKRLAMDAEVLAELQRLDAAGYGIRGALGVYKKNADLIALVGDWEDLRVKWGAPKDYSRLDVGVVGSIDSVEFYAIFEKKEGNSPGITLTSDSSYAQKALVAGAKVTRIEVGGAELTIGAILGFGKVQTVDSSNTVISDKWATSGGIIFQLGAPDGSIGLTFIARGSTSGLAPGISPGIIDQFSAYGSGTDNPKGFGEIMVYFTIGGSKIPLRIGDAPIPAIQTTPY